jgi:photosystem II stability/assembly factor-like uncharacterized protein
LRIGILTLLLLAANARLCGQAWDRLGPEGGMVLSLCADVAGTVYLGTSDGHIFASEDGGAQWELRGRVGTRTDAVIAAMAADPRTPGKIFAAAWFREASAGGGIFRSDDAGRTWLPSGLQREAVRALEFSASEPRIMVAGTHSGVFRSRDAGQTWERISLPDDAELRNVDSIAIDPAQPDLIYAGTYHLPWKTADGGKTWQSIAAGLIDDSDIMSLRVDTGNPARIYLSACSGIYRSENRGDLWTKLQGIPYAARRTQAIVQDPASPMTLYAATTEGLWVTRDAGESWVRTTPKDWVINAAAVLPAQGINSTRVLIGTEAQGVLASEDDGRNFTNANRGFTHRVVKQLVGELRDPMHLLMLLDGNGAELEESRDGGKSWTPLPANASGRARQNRWSAGRIERLYSGPWGWLAKLNDSTLWNYSQRSKLWERWNAGYMPRAQQRSRRTMSTNLSGTPLRVANATPGFSAESVFLPVAEGVLRCDAPGRCALLTAFLRVSRPMAIWASSDGNALVVATEQKLGLSGDAGKSAVWRDLPAGVRTTSWLFAYSPQLPALYLGTDSGLYYSADGGEHWTLNRQGLPTASIRQGLCLARGCLITLEQGGIYYSPDGRGSWGRIDRDAERSHISGLVETQTGQVVFSSQSEGILRWNGAKQPQ